MGIKYLYLKVETRLLFARPMKISGYAPGHSHWEKSKRNLSGFRFLPNKKGKN